MYSGYIEDCISNILQKNEAKYVKLLIDRKIIGSETKSYLKSHRYCPDDIDLEVLQLLIDVDPDIDIA